MLVEKTVTIMFMSLKFLLGWTGNVLFCIISENTFLVGGPRNP